RSDSRQHDAHRVISLCRERLWLLAECLFIVLDVLCSIGVEGGRRGNRCIVCTHTSISCQFRKLRGVEAVRTEEDTLVTRRASLADEDTGLRVDATEVNQVGVERQNRLDDALKVRGFFRSFETEHRQTFRFGGVTEEGRNTLSVSGGVVQHVNRFHTVEAGGKCSARLTLRIVTTADAVDSRIATVSNRDGGIGG